MQVIDFGAARLSRLRRRAAARGLEIVESASRPDAYSLYSHDLRTDVIPGDRPSRRRDLSLTEVAAILNDMDSRLGMA